MIKATFSLKSLERFIKNHSGEFTLNELLILMPNKSSKIIVKSTILELFNDNRIGIDKKGYLVYIWNPRLAKRFLNRRRY